MDKYDKIEELLNSTCYVMDILPQRVEKDDEGQYFAVEDYYRKQAELSKLYSKFTDILLKLNCYYDFQVSFHDGWNKNPLPETLAEWVSQCSKGGNVFLNILIESENVMITVNGDDLYMSLYNPNNKFIALIEKLAGAEGLFVRKGSDTFEKRI